MRVTGVRSNSFQVNYTWIPDAIYTICVFNENSTLLQESRTNLTNITFVVPDPTTNVYTVHVNYSVSGDASALSQTISTSM